MLASTLFNARKQGLVSDEAIKRLMYFSQQCMVDCPKCGVHSWMGFPSISEAEVLYRLADQMTFRKFRKEVERRYKKYRFVCPGCEKFKVRLPLVG
jgi:hypothetical protein